MPAARTFTQGLEARRARIENDDQRLDAAGRATQHQAREIDIRPRDIDRMHDRDGVRAAVRVEGPHQPPAPLGAGRRLGQPGVFEATSLRWGNSPPRRLTARDRVRSRPWSPHSTQSSRSRRKERGDRHDESAGASRSATSARLTPNSRLLEPLPAALFIKRVDYRSLTLTHRLKPCERVSEALRFRCQADAPREPATPNALGP